MSAGTGDAIMRYVFICKAAAASAPVALWLLCSRGCLRARYQPCDEQMLSNSSVHKRRMCRCAWSSIFVRHTQAREANKRCATADSLCQQIPLAAWHDQGWQWQCGDHRRPTRAEASPNTCAVVRRSTYWYRYPTCPLAAVSACKERKVSAHPATHD